MSKNKGAFRKEHSAEIALYEAAWKFLKEHSTDSKLPSMKLLKSEKEQLLQQKKQAWENYHYYRDYKKELNTVRSNVDMILGAADRKQINRTVQPSL
jgi:phenylacetate-coenzyme A ligase PaaK-like adenylate-forming protein